MRALRSPLLQFLLAGAFLLVVVAVGTGELSERAASEEAVWDARQTTEVLARSVAEPAIPRGLVEGRVAAIDRFDRTVLSRLRVDDVQRIKIWDADGTVLYSDETALIGQRYELGAEELAVLRGAPTDAGASDLDRPENRFEEDPSGLLEVYTRIESPEGEALLFEVYFSASDIAARQQHIFNSFRPITLGGLGLLVVLTTPVLWVLNRRLRRAAEERERLLVAAVDASAAERRRIARDLHDGVVQDLAGTSFRLAAAAQQAPRQEDAVALAEMSGSIRAGLRSLRSLLVEIYPADLDSSGLEAALTDLLASAQGNGVSTSVEVDDVSDAPRDVVGIVWRVAQEAVRNALRHGAPDRVEVRVRRTDTSLGLEVSDDGRGFDPGSDPGRSHLGLRGLRDLVHEAGGELLVTSTPGSGTVVRMEVST